MPQQAFGGAAACAISAGVSVRFFDAEQQLTGSGGHIARLASVVSARLQAHHGFAEIQVIRWRLATP